MSDEGYGHAFRTLEERIEKHHDENKLRFASAEDRISELEVRGAAAHERGEASFQMLREIKAKLEAPRWWMIAGVVITVGALVFQAGRYPDREELRGVAARLAQVEIEQRVLRLTLKP